MLPLYQHPAASPTKAIVTVAEIMSKTLIWPSWVIAQVIDTCQFTQF